MGESILYKNIEVQNPFEDSFIADVLVTGGKIAKITPLARRDTSRADEVRGDARLRAEWLREENQCEFTSIRFSGEGTTVTDCTGKIITPGLIDRHTHGGYGCNFNTCTEEELQTYLINCQKHGITSVLPTIMTDSIENINHQIKLIKNIKSKGAKVLGIHLEGVFINPKRKGIHPEKYILPLTKENLDKIDTDFVKIMTYAPELDENGEFLKELIKRNIIPSVGHTDSSFEIANKAFENGAKSATHLFNAMRPIHHREPSCIVAALNNDDVSVEIICDLEHVNKEIIKTVLKLKPKEKIFLISDALPISYSNEKEMIFGGEKIYYNGKRACSKDGTLAGSTLYFDDIYKKIKDFIPFKDFIGYASINVAKSLDLPVKCKIETDTEDFVIWNKKDYSICI